MSVRVEKGKRWFKYTTMLVLAYSGWKAILALGFEDSGGAIALALMTALGGTVLVGGLAFALGWLTGNTPAPVAVRKNEHPLSADQMGAAPATDASLTVPNPARSSEIAVEPSKLDRLSYSEPRRSAATELMTDPRAITHGAATDPLARAAFAQAMRELSTKSYDNGLWAIALVETNGDTRAANVTYIKLRGQELAEASRKELANAKTLERQRVARDAAISAGGLEAWADFLQGGRANESALCAVLPALHALGKDPQEVNSLGDGVIGYAIRNGYLNLAQAAMRGRLALPTRIGGKTPIGIWSGDQTSSITEFVDSMLLPQVHLWIQRTFDSKELSTALWSMVRGVDMQPLDVKQVLANAGARVEETPVNFVLFLDGTEDTREPIWNERELNRRARKIMLDWLDQKIRSSPG